MRLRDQSACTFVVFHVASDPGLTGKAALEDSEQDQVWVCPLLVPFYGDDRVTQLAETA